MDTDILTDTGWLFMSLPCQVSRDVGWNVDKCKEKKTVSEGQISGEKKTREDRDD